MAKYEKLRPRVDEPLRVRGDMRVTLTPNTTGEEAFSTCFFAMTYNGLVLAGTVQELTLVRPESRPELKVPRRTWDPAQILATRLLRLGYLAPDPILRRYGAEIGTREGHAVIVPKANVLIVTDSDGALDKLAASIDSEVMAAMGDATPVDAGGGPALPARARWHPASASISTSSRSRGRTASGSPRAGSPERRPGSTPKRPSG